MARGMPARFSAVKMRSRTLELVGSSRARSVSQ